MMAQSVVRICGLVALGITFACGPGAAETESVHLFEVRFGVFRPAEITLQSAESPETYSAAVHVASAGIIGLLREFHFDLSVQGHRNSGEFWPDHSIGDADTGHRQVQAEMRYVNGTPTIVTIAPPEAHQPWSIDAADQTGTVDQLTALYRIVRAQPRAEVCDWSVDVFDGRRRARVVLDPASLVDGKLVCNGAYIRTAGYSPDDLAARSSYSFSVSYEPTETGEWWLTGAETQTPYGRMRILRQS